METQNLLNETGGMDWEFWKNSTYKLRAMFYLMTPDETFYETRSEVPNLPITVANVFYSFIIVEQILHLIQHGKFNGSLSDAISSMTAGIISILPNILLRKFSINVYDYIFENFRLYDLPWDSVWTYVAAFLLVDFGYYWYHRFGHEINVFWASHQTHHSSEEYNFTTALRQSVFQNWVLSFSYFPLALFVRPSVFMIHSHLNTVYQFWIHTEVVQSCGPLEYIINTPSHHRVHHGRNPYCIDKNYAGVLIIWDKLFGTFEAERKEEKIAYGLVHPLDTYDPIHIQVFNYVYIFKRSLKSKSIGEFFSVLFKGPGWEPGSPRLGFPGSIPEVDFSVPKLSSAASTFFNYYVMIHFSFVTVLFSESAKYHYLYSTLIVSIAVMFVLLNLTCFGWIFDAKPKCLLFETIRCAIFIFFDFYYGNFFKMLLFDSDILYKVFKWIYIISFNLMLILTIKDLAQNTNTVGKNQVVVNKEKEKKAN